MCRGNNACCWAERASALEKTKGQVFQRGRGEMTSRFCVISCATPAVLHPERERFFNLREALALEGAALSLSLSAPAP